MTVVNQALASYEDRLVSLAEHWSEFIQDRVAKQPNVWHDRIGRGAFPLFQGITQKTNIFRGGLGVQSGLTTWSEVGLTDKQSNPTVDGCAPKSPQTYNVAWETVQFKGYEDAWTSAPICLEDMQYQDYAKEQLALIVRSGVDFGVSMLENFNREMYLATAVNAGHAIVLAEGMLGYQDNADLTFDYDPFTVYGGQTFTYIKYLASLKVSTLNWGYLDFIRTSLSQRAAEAAISSESGMPVFGLMIDLLDFERAILADDARREDFRFARPEQLIAGYSMGFKTYRGFALIHDPRQARFRQYKIDTDDGVDYVIARRVDPEREGRSVTVGKIPEPNPEYYQAELAIGVVFMNDVFVNLFPPSVTNLGSGITFGPAPGYAGDWKWLNVVNATTNPFGQIGNFYGRYRIWPKPLLYSTECTVFLYRRCPQALSTGCAIDTKSDATGAIAVAEAAVSADINTTAHTISLTLVGTLPDAVLGSEVTIKKADGNSFSAIVAQDGAAPTYVFAYKHGTANEPSAHTDFTVASTVTVV